MSDEFKAGGTIPPAPAPAPAPAASASFRDGHAQTLLDIARGSQVALTALYAHFAPKVFNTAKRIGISPQCAQEVVCDVFIFVWRNARAYDPTRGSVNAWLSVIARNRAIDRWRRNGRQRFFADDGACQAEEPQNPEWLVSQSQQRSILHAALDELSPLKKRLLMLVFFEGLSHDEIAEDIGMPLGTVKSHVRRGLLTMRSVLAPGSEAPAA